AAAGAFFESEGGSCGTAGEAGSTGAGLPTAGNGGSTDPALPTGSFFESSSNGRSKRSFTCHHRGVARLITPSRCRARRFNGTQMFEFLETVAHALDACREPGPLVGFDDDGIQARITGRGFEFSRHRIHKTSDCRIDVDANHRVVRPRHADVSEVRGTFGKDPLVGGLHMGVRSY